MNSLVAGNWIRRHSTTFFISAILRDQKSEYKYFIFILELTKFKKRNSISHHGRLYTHAYGFAVPYGSLIREIRSLKGSDRTVFGLTSVAAETQSCMVTGASFFIKVIQFEIERNILWHKAASFYQNLYSRERVLNIVTF